MGFLIFWLFTAFICCAIASVKTHNSVHILWFAPLLSIIPGIILLIIAIFDNSWFFGSWIPLTLLFIAIQIIITFIPALIIYLVVKYCRQRKQK